MTPEEIAAAVATEPQVPYAKGPLPEGYVDWLRECEARLAAIGEVFPGSTPQVWAALVAAGIRPFFYWREERLAAQVVRQPVVHPTAHSVGVPRASNGAGVTGVSSPQLPARSGLEILSVRYSLVWTGPAEMAFSRRLEATEFKLACQEFRAVGWDYVTADRVFRPKVVQ